MLPHILAGLFDHRWQTDGIPGLVHGRGYLSDVYGLLHFSLVPGGFTCQYFGGPHGLAVSCGPTMISYSCWFIQVHVIFETLAEMTIPQLVELFDCCLNTTYFIYDVTYYQQTHGAAMGSPICSLVANCNMEQFEKTAISTPPHPPPPHITVAKIRG